MRKALIAGIVVAGIIATAPAAFAEARECRGTIGAARVDSIVVPQGASCTLDGTRVRGNVQVEEGATLTATGVIVQGNVQADGAMSVSLTDSRVRGNVSIQRSTGAVTVTGTTIQGSLQADENTGGVTIADNRIGNNLQCSENDPAPMGGNNMVRGEKSDQCAAL
jgi:hypothetical protein